MATKDFYCWKGFGIKVWIVCQYCQFMVCLLVCSVLVQASIVKVSSVGCQGLNKNFESERILCTYYVQNPCPDSPFIYILNKFG